MKKLIAMLMAATMMLSFAACSSAEEGGDVAEGGDQAATIKTDLVYGMASEPTSLDPHTIASMNAFTVTYSVYDTLTADDGNGGYMPHLASDVTVSEDGLLYTITLDKEVYFQDGTQLTTEDIAFSLNRTIAAGWAFDMTLAIEEVVLVDDKTVEIRLHTPFGGMMGSLASPFFSIMSKNYVETNGDDYIKRNPMGTGAYKLVEWVSGDSIVFESHEEYFMGAPAIKDLTFKPIVDKNTALIALENGDIDVYLNINATDIPLVEANEDLAIDATDVSAVTSLNMNVEDEILSDVLVRQAIYSAINKDDIIAVAISGRGTPANSAIPTVCAGYSADMPGSVYDPDAAKDYLAQAGYADGLTLTLRIAEDNTDQKIAQVIQSQLGEVGINVEIDMMEAGAYNNAIYTNGDYQLNVGSWSAMFLDAYSLMYSQFHKDCYGPTGNITHVVSDELSSLLDAAAMADDATKVEAYEAVTQNILDNAYQLPLIYEDTTIVYNADLKGVEAKPMGVYFVKDWSF